ncbi:MAG: hypothetical protein JWN72_1632, partial [Thermoleophilia bacterium]|nr:hypothetical protein [Thermoleophilia bacterium]
DESIDITDDQLYHLLSCLGAKFRWANVQKLQDFDGVAGYTKFQGEE